MSTPAVTIHRDEVLGLVDDVPLPGGRTAERWSHLSGVARRDLCLVKLVESHLDALAVLHDLGAGHLARPGRVWGVWAAEPQGTTLSAEHGPHGWQLTGTKPFCSGARVVDDALVTAPVDAASALFHVDLRGLRAHWSAAPSAWVGSGMARAGTSSLHFDVMPVTAVGSPGDYLARAGFWHGGMGIAACWFGGLLGVSGMLQAASRRRDPGPYGLAALGRVAVHVDRCRAHLTAASASVDADPEDRSGTARRVAESLRADLADSAEDVLRLVGSASGPGPLAFDAEHTHRVDDLHVFVRQHHGERDLAALGELVRDGTEDW